MSTLAVKLTEGMDWSGVIFEGERASVWGTGQNSGHIWGEGGTGSLSVTNPIKQFDHWSIQITIDNPNPDQGEQLGLITRYRTSDGVAGIFCATTRDF